MTETDVVIYNETYSILSRPSEESALVREEKDKLLGSLDLEQLVKYLGHVGSFIRIAYNGVGAAGPKFIDLQIEIQRLGYDITKLCDKSAVTVASFESTSKTVVLELEATYQYLLDGFEDQAIISFASLSKLAKKMAAAARSLQVEFEDQEKKVILTLETTQRKRATEEIEEDKLRKEREKMEIKKKTQEELLEKQKRLEQEAHKERLYYEKKEDEEIDSAHSGAGVLSIIGAVVTSACSAPGVAQYGGFVVGPAVEGTINKVVKEKQEAHKAKAEEWKKKSHEKLKAEKELRQLQQEGLQQMAEFTCEIQRLTSEGNVAEIAIKALHEACGALKHLSVIMRQAALFWEQLSTHCESLAQPQFQKEVEKALDYQSDEKKRRFFLGKGFKTKAVSYYARWVALYTVCAEYSKQIQITQKDLYDYIISNPTGEESRQQLPILAEEFGEILKSAQDEIAQRDFEADEQMKMLTSGDTSSD